MIEITGKYAEAKIFGDQADNNVISQIINVLNHPMMEGAQVRLQPDFHFGAGVPIGFTAKLADGLKTTAPDLVGVDIGCGVLAHNLGVIDIDYPDLDDFIRNNIPFGFNVRNKTSTKIRKDNPFLKKVDEITQRLGLDINRTMKSIGTLGGGNHFHEIGVDENKNRWLTIHSGSRQFGYSICRYYNQKTDEKIVGIKTVSGDLYDEYIHDMNIAQEFAYLSREIMARDIIEDYFGIDVIETVHSVHNYHDLEDNTIRKGATPARKGEALVIPFNMKDGSIIGVGKGNPDWNYSAPHGAGRKMGRSAAKKRLHINEFERQMEGIYSSCVSQRFLDESPSAYKKPNTILEYLPETLNIVARIKTTYNFKG